MSLSMLLSVLIILQELINLQTRRKMLNMKMYTMYAADRIFTPDELKLLEDHQRQEILDTLVYPDPHCCRALKTSWNDTGLDIHNTVGMFVWLFGELCDFDEADNAILLHNNMTVKDCYNMNAEALRDAGFSDDFVKDIDNLNNIVCNFKKRVDEVDHNLRYIDKNIGSICHETDNQISFLEDLRDTFIKASLNGSLNDITKKNPQGLGVHDAINILLEALGIDSVVALGYEYGQLLALPSEILKDRGGRHNDAG